MDERPKRRKNKDNPYELISYTKQDNKEYLVAFKDVNGDYKKLKISEEVFLELNQFELDDLKEMNEYDRHIEHSILYEDTLMKRILKKASLVDEQVEINYINEKLKKAIKKLSETERKRVILYFDYEMTEEQIGKLEGCSQQAISKNILYSLKKIKKFLKNGL